MFARALLWSGRVLGKIFEDGEGWHGKNLLVFHEPHGLIAQLVGMVYRSHSCLRGEKRPRLSSGMHCDAPSQACCFFDGGFQLRLGVLIRSREFSVSNGILPSLINFDEV